MPERLWRPVTACATTQQHLSCTTWPVCASSPSGRVGVRGRAVMGEHGMHGREEPWLAIRCHAVPCPAMPRCKCLVLAWDRLQPLSRAGCLGLGEAAVEREEGRERERGRRESERERERGEEREGERAFQRQQRHGTGQITGQRSRYYCIRACARFLGMKWENDGNDGTRSQASSGSGESRKSRNGSIIPAAALHSRKRGPKRRRRWHHLGSTTY